MFTARRNTRAHENRTEFEIVCKDRLTWKIPSNIRHAFPFPRYIAWVVVFFLSIRISPCFNFWRLAKRSTNKYLCSKCVFFGGIFHKFYHPHTSVYALFYFYFCFGVLCIHACVNAFHLIQILISQWVVRSERSLNTNQV